MSVSIKKNHQNNFSFLQVFITESYDATTHFESTCDDVVKTFQRITGEPFDFSQVKHTELNQDCE